MNQFEAGMLLSSKTAKEAAFQVEWLKKKTDELGINFRSATQDFTMFSATTTAAGATQSQTRVMFTDIMKIQTALGMTPDMAEGMTRALGQMVSKGQVMSEELKGQLAERVPGAVAVMADALGVKVPKLFEMMKNGLPAGEAVAKFLEKFSQKAEESGALKKQMEGLQATINRLNNAWTDIMKALGEAGVLDALINGLKWVTQGIRFLIPYIPVLKQHLQDAWTYAKKLGDFFIQLGKAAIVLAISAALVAVAIWLLNGGFSALLALALQRIVMFFMALNMQMVRTAISTIIAAAGFLLIVGAVLMLAALLYALQDVYSDDSRMLKWMANWEWLNTVFGMLYSSIESVVGLWDSLTNLQVPQWVSTFGDTVGEMGSILSGKSEFNLMQSQKTAAAGNTNNTSSDTYNIFAKAGETVPSIVTGLQQQGGNTKSMGNAPA